MRLSRTISILVLLVAVPASGADRFTDEVRTRVATLRHTWSDRELPFEGLSVEPGRGAVRVSAAAAAADVERLFYLFEHGYSGYAWFDGDGRFARAREAILAELATERRWAPGPFAELIRRHLGFIRDCHTSIGDVTYGGHLDFWCDERYDVRRVGDRFEIEREGEKLPIAAIEGEPPEVFLRPSLNARGEAVHRIGVLARDRPEPLRVAAGGKTIRVDLRRSRLRSFSRRIYREDRVGGVPVLRIRSFSDHHADDLRRFVAAARRLRGEACVIVDLRGNGGGNERWVNEWVRTLTGGTPRSPFITSELTSRTTMAGRANYMAWLRHHYPDVELYGVEAERFAVLSRGIGPGGREPSWTGPWWPDNPVIPNDTTVVIVTNGFVASAGEGFVLRATQAENVVVVGENTQGALTFGNVSAHQLPHSGLTVHLPINFGLFPDLVFREEVGLSPDWWVPAEDAVNFAVAAIRAGTIPTVRGLTASQRAETFVPETRALMDGPYRWLPFPIAGIACIIIGRLFLWWRRRLAPK